MASAFLELAALACVFVERAGEGGPKAGEVGAAINVANGVGEGVNLFGHRVAIGQGDFDVGGFHLPAQHDGVGMQPPAAAGEAADE